MKFNPGTVYMTCGVNARVAEDALFAKHVTISLNRHLAGDWGDICEEDKELNEEALKEGGRLFSSYGKGSTRHVWIITEVDRSATTILFPSEY